MKMMVFVSEWREISHYEAVDCTGTAYAVDGDDTRIRPVPKLVEGESLEWITSGVPLVSYIPPEDRG